MNDSELQGGTIMYDPDIHHRRSIRLRGYDYAQVGAYFVTVCTQDRECLFGEVVGGEMQLNDVGHLIETLWEEMPDHYAGVQVDAFMVMPNHIHGIIILTKKMDTVGAGPRACPDSQGQPRGVAPTAKSMSLPDVVHRFKSLTTARYRHGVRNHGWPAFRGRLWQRNYYEQVIRDDDDLNTIQEYIVNNPARWDEDTENPDVFVP